MTVKTGIFYTSVIAGAIEMIFKLYKFIKIFLHEVFLEYVKNIIFQHIFMAALKNVVIVYLVYFLLCFLSFIGKFEFI